MRWEKQAKNYGEPESTLGDRVIFEEPLSPTHMIPTTRAYLLFLLAGILGAIAYSFFPKTNIPILLLLGLHGGIFAALFWDARAAQQGRVIVRRAPLSRLSIGQFNPVHLTIETGKLLASNWIEVRDTYPKQFPVQLPSTDRYFFPAHTFFVETKELEDTIRIILPPNTQQELVYTIKPLQRGVFTWGKIQVRQRGPWGLAWHDWLAPGENVSVSVYPDLLALRALTIKLSLQATGSIRQRRRIGIGTEFAELRDYAEGDDPRLIDWKATARRERPLLRVLEPEQEQTLLILLDRGRLMTAQVKGLSRFDHGLNATLALATAGLHRGDRVGIGVFDREMHLWIPPERGHYRLAKIMEKMASLQPELLEPDYMLAVSKVLQQQTRRALVVIITDLIDSTASAELIAALTRLTPRYLPFSVTLRDPEVDRLAHTFTPPNQIDRQHVLIKDAYTRAVALDLLSQRELVFATLRQKGVLVLDAPAHKVSEPLVDRYLQLKARNQL